MAILTIFLALLLGGLCLYRSFSTFFRRKSTFFKDLGIPHITPLPILGNMAPCLFRRISFMELVQNVYNLAPEAKYVGFYHFKNPIFLLRDPELISSITIKNFESFCDHRTTVDVETEWMMGKNLFLLRGDVWREMRKVVSPTFTLSKMKLMSALIVDCAEKFSVFVAAMSSEGRIVNMKDIIQRCTNDVVASCAFGISIDSLNDPNNEFYKFGKNVFNFDDSSFSLKFILGDNFIFFSKLFGLRMFDAKAAKFFESVIADTVETRKRHNIVRPDMIQLLIESKEKGQELSIQDITAQAFVFFIAGADSTATLTCFVAQELAAHPEVQKRLRAEVEEVYKQNIGRPTYDAVMSMTYLDAVVNETLRLYPLVAFLDRICVKEFELPPATPNGKPVTLKKDSTVWFSSYSLQRDPKYFPNPDKFDPERFVNEEIDQSVYLPFGAGPRFCIGNRFAKLQVKLVIFYLLLRCELDICEKTRIPMKLNEKSFVMLPKGGFWLKVRARNCSASTNFCEKNGGLSENIEESKTK